VPVWRLLGPALAAALACACLGVGAARPALRDSHRLSVRARSEVLYVVDVSRSMAASHGPAGETRLAQARQVVASLHDGAVDVPSGLAGMTDRVLPYLFPTARRAVFEETLRRSVLLEAPPPQEVAPVATSFASLGAIPGGGFFDRAARWRTCVLVTDGETQPYDAAPVADALAGGRGCRLVVVRVGDGAERVYGPDGVAEAGYAPDRAAGARVDALAEAAGGRAFTASNEAAARAAVRADAERGPVVPTTVGASTTSLAPWLALAALIVTGCFAAQRLLRAVPRRTVL
jgi:hypothetical protein